MSHNVSVAKLFFLITLAVVPPVFSQTAYLCVPSKSTGFAFDGRTWTNATFNIEKEKKLLKVNGNSSEWLDLGQQNGMLCGGFSANGVLSCNLVFGELWFNKKTLRYMETYLAGYVDGRDEKGNTPYITIGKCSPI